MSENEQTAEQAHEAQEEAPAETVAETKVEENPAPATAVEPAAQDPAAADETPAAEEFAPKPGVGGTRHGLLGIAAGPADHPRRTRALADE